LALAVPMVAIGAPRLRACMFGSFVIAVIPELVDSPRRYPKHHNVCI